MNKNIFCFAPYSNYHSLHGMWESTILHALKLRGAHIRYVLCDGMGDYCDLFRLNPSNKNCAECLHKSSFFAKSMGMNFSLIREFIDEDEIKVSADWVSNLDRNQLLNAKYNTWGIGNWVKSSLHTFFREESLNIKNSYMQEVVLSYLKTGILTAFAINRIINTYNFDAFFLFNGRFAMSRVAMELALLTKIPVYTHERGAIKETVSLGKNCYPRLRPAFENIWQMWKDVPLNKSECYEVGNLLTKWSTGKEDNWRSYSLPVNSSKIMAGIHEQMNEKKIIVIFTSSFDELATNEYCKNGAFQDQVDWLVGSLLTLNIVNNVYSIVRIHPNTGGKRSFGKCHGSLRFFAEIRKQFPHVLFIDPDDEISSYDLVNISHAGLVFASTIGLEMAARGIPVLCGASTYYSMCPAVELPATPQEYVEKILEIASLPQGSKNSERQRMAFRYIYRAFITADTYLPHVRMDTPYTGKLTYSSIAELREGVSPGLDHICNVILHDEPIYLPPENVSYDTSDEDAFFASLNKSTIL